MRKLAAAVVAIPFILFLYVSSLVRRALPGASGARPPKVQMAARPADVARETIPARSAPAARGPMATRSAMAVKAPMATRSRRPAGGGLGIPMTAQIVGMGVAVVLLVGGLLLGLPAKEVAGVAPPTFAPLTPQAEPQGAGATLSLDVPFEVQFTKPMNEGSVESALTISPNAGVTFRWDATAQVVSLVPSPYWTPQTAYTVDISAAASDQEGLPLAPIHTSFESGAPTSGQIVATALVGDQAAPTTTFQLTFTRPVKLSTVMARVTLNPPQPVTVSGDDPTDVASQVFTITPNDPLASDTDYSVTFADGGTDSAGAAIATVPTYFVHTLLAPAVVRFRPVDGGVTYDTNQPVSVRFTAAMDEKSTAAAFSVTVNGKAVAGSKYWAEGDTVRS